MRGPARGELGWLSALAIVSLSDGCIIAGDKCDAHQVHLDGDYNVCVCEPNAALNASGAGCTPCGDNQEVQNGACSCKSGFVRAADGASCIASEIGARCTADMPCTQAAFPYCSLDADGDGYCTSQGCTANSGCPAGWSCEAAAGTRYCHRPRTGLGAPCNSNAECSTFEANYCESIQSHTCFLQGCAVSTLTCPNEWGCCDYSALFGAPLSFCNPPEMLVAGACPQGGRLVTP